MSDPVRLPTDMRVASAAFRFQSKSDPKLTYDCALMADGALSCECWPWLANDDCAHAREVRRLLREERK